MLSSCLKPASGDRLLFIREQAAPGWIQYECLDIQPRFRFRGSGLREDPPRSRHSPLFPHQGKAACHIVLAVRSCPSNHGGQRILEPAFELPHGSPSPDGTQARLPETPPERVGLRQAAPMVVSAEADRGRGSVDDRSACRRLRPAARATKRGEPVPGRKALRARRPCGTEAPEGHRCSATPDRRTDWAGSSTTAVESL